MISELTGIIRNIDDNSRLMALSSYQVATISHEIGQVSKTEDEHAAEVNQASDLRSGDGDQGRCSAHHCGIKFVELNAETERQLKMCFDYFHKEPRFASAALPGGAVTSVQGGGTREDRLGHGHAVRQVILLSGPIFSVHRD